MILLTLLRSYAYFYPRSPCGERPIKIVTIAVPRIISIHALLAESDLPGRQIGAFHRDFYPRSPCGERRQASVAQVIKKSDFYPRSPCGERPYNDYVANLHRGISIHALLAESDKFRSFVPSDNVISIHALLAESDIRTARTAVTGAQFLSTLSLRRATICIASGISVYIEFLSTLSLRRATEHTI